MVVPPDINDLPQAELKQLLLKLQEENAELNRQNAELREEIARTQPAVSLAIGNLLDRLTAAQCANYFRNAGYASSQFGAA